MINLHQKNIKLAGRAINIVKQALGLDRDRALKLLRSAGNSVPAAIVMHSANVPKNRAERALTACRGNVRKAIAHAGR